MIIVDEPGLDGLGNQWVDAAPFRALLHHLMAVGRVSASDLAALAGVSRCLVDHLVHGRNGRPVRRISPQTGLALIQLENPRVQTLRHVRVPAGVAREQLDRLRRAGWSDEGVRQAIGATPLEFASICRWGDLCSELMLVRLRALCRDLDADLELDAALELDADPKIAA